TVLDQLGVMRIGAGQRQVDADRDRLVGGESAKRIAASEGGNRKMNDEGAARQHGEDSRFERGVVDGAIFALSQGYGKPQMATPVGLGRDPVRAGLRRPKVPGIASAAAR